MKLSMAICERAWAFKPSPLRPEQREVIKKFIERRAQAGRVNEAEVR